MSILLESLSKESPSKQQDIPDLHASHYDDEMLGDEWLLKRLRVWQIATAILLVLLLISWSYFLFSGKNIDSSSTSADIATVTAESNKRSSPSDISDKTIERLKQTAEVSETKSSEPKSNGAKAENFEKTQTDSQSTDKNKLNRTTQVYKPQKRRPQETAENSSQNATQSTVSNTTSGQNAASNTSKKIATIMFDELSIELQQQFPQISINSYVVAEKPGDSFVILDGDFYKINQVITPDLVLRGITSEHIVVEYRSYLVKIPHQ
ncbi:GspB domain-containing protein [Aliikangiella coralliicola]|uniref:Uncharacterized protein n=1 Tax=Aliikangiella coralliicola TaxID=2592383 RepID=A0A545UE12_9GAMM|nr:GspB domain-containing protein [Aliikangiella coralliicola]TQV87700.1 hypothetical protein FLL46_09955 [Aliikangiella coralliicola]